MNKTSSVKRRINLIFPIFALLDISMVWIAGLSGYGGWAAMIFIIIIPGLLIIGAILAVLFDKNFDEKITALLGKIGYSIFPALYACIILFGVFFVGDNGDGEGSGSTFSVILAKNNSNAINSLSFLMESIAFVLFCSLFLVLAASLIAYGTKKYNNKPGRATVVHQSPKWIEEKNKNIRF